MKKAIIINYLSSPLALAVLLCAGCRGNMDYDISEGFNKEVTLFENEISVPIGSIGPVTIGSTLDGLSQVEGVGGVVGQYIKQDANGNLTIQDEGQIYRISVYELERQAGDVSAPFRWNAGNKDAFVGGMASALKWLGLTCPNQKFTITASNPLYVDVPMGSNASLRCMDNNYSYSYSAGIGALDGYTLKAWTNNSIVTTIDLPADVADMLYSVSLGGLYMDLPANPTSKIAEKVGNLFFDLSYQYVCGISVGGSFSMSVQDGPIKGTSLPLGKYRLKKCELSVEAESTLPMAVQASELKALRLKDKNDESAGYDTDDNIVFSTSLTLAGGSVENPATSLLKLSVEALDGTIPDIDAISAKITLSAQPGLGIVPLSARQGLVIKSSSAKLTGGITIPQD